jgi:hypothetical protein
MLPVTIYLTCAQLEAMAAGTTAIISAVAQFAGVLAMAEILMQLVAAEQLVAGPMHTFGTKGHQAGLRWVLKDPGMAETIAVHVI